MIEIWKPIPSAPTYVVSNLGKIKSKHNRILTPCLSNSGYYLVCVFIEKKRKTIYIHRAVAEAFVNKPKNYCTVVNHKNYNKQDNRVENLEWVNGRENMKHSNKRYDRLCVLWPILGIIPEEKLDFALNECCQILQKYV